MPPLKPAIRDPRWLVMTAVIGVAIAGCGGMGRNDNAEGVKLYQQRNYLGAVNSFQQALAKQPGNPDCFYNLGATYHQQAKLLGRPDDLKTAEQYYHLCLARNPNHDACQRALAVLLVEEDRSNEAVEQLESWARLAPTNPLPHVELARLASEHQDLREAENQLTEALKIDPNNTRALVAMGQLRETAGDPNQAIANYSRALAIDPQQPVVAARVASIQASQVSAARMAALPPPAVGLAPPPVGMVPTGAFPPPSAAPMQPPPGVYPPPAAVYPPAGAFPAPAAGMVPPGTVAR